MEYAEIKKKTIGRTLNKEQYLDNCNNRGDKWKAIQEGIQVIILEEASDGRYRNRNIQRAKKKYTPQGQMEKDNNNRLTNFRTVN